MRNRRWQPAARRSDRSTRSPFSITPRAVWSLHSPAANVGNHQQGQALLCEWLQWRVQAPFGSDRLGRPTSSFLYGNPEKNHRRKFRAPPLPALLHQFGSTTAGKSPGSSLLRSALGPRAREHRIYKVQLVEAAASRERIPAALGAPQSPRSGASKCHAPLNVLDPFAKIAVIVLAIASANTCSGRFVASIATR